MLFMKKLEYVEKLLRVKNNWKKFYFPYSTHFLCAIQMKMCDMINPEIILLPDVCYEGYILI